MSDHGDVTDVLTLLDDAFGGAVDARELISKVNDPSEVHVNAPLKVRKKKMVVKPTPSVTDAISKGLQSIVNHRRLGAITTEQAFDLATELVSKAGALTAAKKVVDDSHINAVASTWGASTRMGMESPDVRGPVQEAPKGAKGKGSVKSPDKEDPEVKQRKIERKVDEVVPKPKKLDPALLNAAPPQPAFAGPMSGPQQPSAPLKGGSKTMEKPPGKPKEKDKGPIAKSATIGGTPSKKETRTGQALNVVAATGGAHAIYMTGKELQHVAREGVKTGRHEVPKVATKLTRIAGSKVLRPITSNPKRAALASLGGWGVLHTSELMGDAIAARSLHRQSKVAKRGKRLARYVGNIAAEAGQRAAKEATAETTRGAEQVAARFDRSTRKAAAATSLGLATGIGGGVTLGAAGKKVVNDPPKLRKKELSKSLDLEWTGEISKFDTDKRLVFGWCSLSKVDGSPVVDLQGDYVPIETTEQAAYRYVIHSRKGGDMHSRVAKRTGFNLERDEPLHTSDLVESFVVTQEKLKALGLSPDALPEGWWVGFKVNDDEQWRKVKSGERPGFSIHGSGARVPISA